MPLCTLVADNSLERIYIVRARASVNSVDNFTDVRLHLEVSLSTSHQLGEPQSLRFDHAPQGFDLHARHRLIMRVQPGIESRFVLLESLMVVTALFFTSSACLTCCCGGGALRR